MVTRPKLECKVIEVNDAIKSRMVIYLVEIYRGNFGFDIISFFFVDRLLNLFIRFTRFCFYFVPFVFKLLQNTSSNRLRVFFYFFFFSFLFHSNEPQAAR